MRNDSVPKRLKSLYLLALQLGCVQVACGAVDLPLANSVITGVDGVSIGEGTVQFTIYPEKILNGLGFRKYDNFLLKDKDKANFVMSSSQSVAAGGIGDFEISRFINLVGGTNPVIIQGIADIQRDGTRGGTHVTFITPNGDLL